MSNKDLKIYRKNAKLTQTDIATLLDCSQSIISLIENEKVSTDSRLTKNTKKR